VEIERGSTRSHCVENWLCKRLWTSRKTVKGKGKAIPLQALRIAGA